MGRMSEEERNALLAETLRTGPQAGPYLDTRLRGMLSLRRRERRAISLWWVPLALSVPLALLLYLAGCLVFWPLSAALQAAAPLTMAATLLFTLVGLWRFDLRERGRVVL